MSATLRSLLEKFKESFISTVPFFVIIVALYLIFLPFNIWAFVGLFVATALMIVGMSLFNIGVDMSTMKMGGYVGSHLSKSRRLTMMTILSFILGFIVTIAEPDLMVLAEQVPGISSKWIILITVSCGTGIFLVLSTLRTIFRLNIKVLLIVSYALTLVLCIFSPLQFLPLAFDTMGVTTGAVSVPFIMAFGLGICAVRSGKNNQNDGFGLIALASIGPVLAILIVSMFLKSGAVAEDTVATMVSTSSELGMSIGTNILSYLKEVFVVIIPIFVFFLLYNFIFLKLPMSTLIRIFIGLIYTYIGLVIFLTGVSVGYLPTAQVLGHAIVGVNKWWLVPLGLIMGFTLIFAEPAVHVLNKQVEDITEGIISKKTMLIGLSIGVAIAMLIIVLRAILAIDFMWICTPIVLIMIVLSIFTPELFEGIAFDSGGVAAGSLSASFILPFVSGVCGELGLNSMLYAFGSIAIVAMIPTIVIQIMGIKYQSIINKSKATTRKTKPAGAVTIIEFED